MLTRKQRSEILRLANQMDGPKRIGAYARLADYLDSITVPEGWQVVPVEPTREMIEAARQHHEGEAYLPFSLYKAMLAVAPKPGDSSAPEKSRSQRMAEKGFTRRPTWRSLPKDGDAESDKETGDSNE